MYAIVSTVYDRNRDGTYSKQSVVVLDYFEHYEDARAYLGDDQGVYVYRRVVEVLTVGEAR